LAATIIAVIKATGKKSAISAAGKSCHKRIALQLLGPADSRLSAGNRKIAIYQNKVLFRKIMIRCVAGKKQLISERGYS